MIEKNDNLFYYALPDPNRGACAARNYGISQAHGMYIAGLDDDDEFVPERIEKMMAAMSDEVAFVCSAGVICDEKNRKKIVRYFFKDRCFSLYDLLWCNVVGNQVLVKKEFNGQLWLPVSLLGLPSSLKLGWFS